MLSTALKMCVYLFFHPFFYVTFLSSRFAVCQHDVSTSLLPPMSSSCRWNQPWDFPGAVWSTWTSVSPADRPKERDPQTALVPAAVAVKTRTKGHPTRGVTAAHRHLHVFLCSKVRVQLAPVNSYRASFLPPFVFSLGRSDAGSADKTAPPPPLPPPRLPRHPLHSALLEPHPASPRMLFHLLLACLTLLMSSKCLSWTPCPPFPSRHLRSMSRNGSRWEEQRTH